LIDYAQVTLDQIAALESHYARLNRPEAIARLVVALREAEYRIESMPWAGLPAPRPYPSLAKPGIAWTLSGRYWIAYRLTTPAIIIGVFYEQANIPGRS